MISASSESLATSNPTLVGRLPGLQVEELWQKVVAGVTGYGFAIDFRTLEPPKTGIFDGLRITLDPALDPETRCFVLLHLFGHSIQWVAPSLEATVVALQQAEDRELFMQTLHDYEFAAAGYGLQLLHEMGVTGLDQWFSDFVESDWRYVATYYRTGRIPALRDCVAGGCQLIKPAPIPPLKHRRVEVRFAF